jgi:hypothetical protein
VLADGLRKQGLEVWLDQLEILPGDNWAEVMSKALRELQAMVVLFTPGAQQSRNVRWEVEFALGHRGYRGRLIPVLVGPPQIVPLEAVPGVLERYAIRLDSPAKVAEAVKSITHTLRAAA